MALRPKALLFCFILGVSPNMALATVPDNFGANPKPFTSFPKAKPFGVVEAVTDKGLIQEMIVRCPHGANRISYSQPEHVFCAPDLHCFREFKQAWSRSCNAKESEI